MLYIADEVFFSGTAAEITPVRSIDRIKIGNGAAAPSRKRCKMNFSPSSGKTPRSPQLAIPGERPQRRRSLRLATHLRFRAKVLAST